jgi:hypothetical protein
MSGLLNLNVDIHQADYGGSHKLKRQLLWWRRKSRTIELSSAWIVLVVEGHEDRLMESLCQSVGWTQSAIDAVRLARNFHDKLVDILQQRPGK